jgi:hypothetical protein
VPGERDTAHAAAGKTLREGRMQNPPSIGTKEMDECVQYCMECHRACTRTVTHLIALEDDTEPADARQLTLLLDCAQLSATCADFMIRASEFSTMIGGLCAEVCRSCKQVCEGLEAADAVAQECAAACGRCANACARASAAAA